MRKSSRNRDFIILTESESIVFNTRLIIEQASVDEVIRISSARIRIIYIVVIRCACTGHFNIVKISKPLEVGFLTVVYLLIIIEFDEFRGAKAIERAAHIKGLHRSSEIRRAIARRSIHSHDEGRSVVSVQEVNRDTRVAHEADRVVDVIGANLAKVSGDRHIESANTARIFICEKYGIQSFVDRVIVESDSIITTVSTITCLYKVS